MRIFQVKVQGQVYEVEVEEISGRTQPEIKNIQVKAESVAPAETAPAAETTSVSAAPANAEDCGAITAPMPGKIVRIAVQVGQTVKEGDLIVVLEAMKMENDIVSNRKGTVTAIVVASGAAVNPGEIMVLIG